MCLTSNPNNELHPLGASKRILPFHSTHAGLDLLVGSIHENCNYAYSFATLWIAHLQSLRLLRSVWKALHSQHESKFESCKRWRKTNFNNPTRRVGTAPHRFAWSPSRLEILGTEIGISVYVRQDEVWGGRTIGGITWYDYMDKICHWFSIKVTNFMANAVDKCTFLTTSDQRPGLHGNDYMPFMISSFCCACFIDLMRRVSWNARSWPDHGELELTAGAEM